MSLFQSVAVVAALAAGSALAQSARATLVPVPLEADPNPALARFDEQLKSVFFGLIEERSGMLLPTKKEIESALKDTKRQDFRESDEGIAKLATKAGTLYGLFTTLEYTPKKMLILSGRVVRDDGKLMKSAQVSLPKAGDTIVDVLRPLTIQLIAQLGLSTLPNFKPAAVETPPVVAVPELAPTPVEPALVPVPADGQGTVASGGRTAGWATLGVGVAAAAAGIGLGVAALTMRPTLAPNGLPRSEDDLRSARSSNSLATAGLISGIAGAALVSTGAFLLLTAGSRPSAAGQIGVAASGDGAMVFYGGRF